MKHTPLYEEHMKLGGKMVEFGGWEMPLNFPAGILAEHLATRRVGGLFDISHMGRFRITGKDALPFMQYVLTNNAAALAAGQSQYTIIPNESGGAIDDAFLYRIDEREYLLVVNAANTEKDWLWFQRYQGKFPRLILEDHTAKLAMLSLQGPKAKAVLGKVLGNKGRLPEPVRNTLAIALLLGVDVPIARTGYTGEPIGFELFPPADIAVSLYRKLLEEGKEVGVVPVGLGARDTLRLEAGLPLHGHELGTDGEGKEIPIFALPAARIAVSFNKIKGEFVGREALARQFEEIKQRKEGRLNLPGERLLVPRTMMRVAIYGGIARAGYPVYIDNKLAGNVTSGTATPYWETAGMGAASQPGTESHTRAIGTAYLDADLQEGQKTTVAIRGRSAGAVIVKRHLSARAPPYARPIIIQKQTKKSSIKREESMKDLDVNLVRKTSENTLWRQKKTINLIPSENTTSALVRLLTIADPSGR